jgi:NAD(P)-dependent dehydrogenase (short-subunit alcohol dehydrogenase family)
VGELSGKVAIVTGAAQGLGAEYALQLARRGVRVVAADARPVDSTVATIDAEGGHVLAVRVDVADAASVQAMVNLSLATFETVDILVNNAAIAADLRMKPFLDISSDEWDRVMGVNARGTFLCIKAAAVPMIAQGRGKIVNVASTTFFKGAPRMMHYVASKGAVIGITRVAARELGPRGITVNCIAPGLTMTEPIRSKGDFAGTAYEASIASRAVPREQVPMDLVGTMMFLASSHSDFISGQTIVVDGGGVML